LRVGKKFRGFLAYIIFRFLTLPLLEVLESRNGLRSTAVTTQLPIDLWYRYIGDAMIADAILRRLLNCSHKIELEGEMLDQKEAK